mgnify:CR=1 FL=1
MLERSQSKLQIQFETMIEDVQELVDAENLYHKVKKLCETGCVFIELSAV